MSDSYAEAPNQTVSGPNKIDYLYRQVGDGSVPVVLLQHFRGNLDNWDPVLIDELSARHSVVTFDNVGVGGSSGLTPSTIEQMARDALAFLDAIGLVQVDLLGFSIGSFVAQEVCLIRPEVVRRLVLASSAPRGAPGMHGWAPDVIRAVGQPERNPQGYLDVFFTQSTASREAGTQAQHRMFTRQVDRDRPTTWQTRLAQYDAVCTWGIPDRSSFERLGAIEQPVFVANGDSDPMILPRYSYLLVALLPNAQLAIYPDSAHGFLFQHHVQFASDVDRFLAAPD
jgi:pimeloyl-ACP methyl ester carboxylesterase